MHLFLHSCMQRMYYCSLFAITSSHILLDANESFCSAPTTLQSLQFASYLFTHPPALYLTSMTFFKLFLYPYATLYQPSSHLLRTPYHPLTTFFPHFPPSITTLFQPHSPISPPSFPVHPRPAPHESVAPPIISSRLQSIFRVYGEAHENAASLLTSPRLWCIHRDYSMHLRMINSVTRIL